MDTDQLRNFGTGASDGYPILAALGGSHVASDFVWVDTLWFGLAVSVIVGLVYTLVLMGPAPLNPRNVGWLTPDGATYCIGWELFRQDPSWHWPLTYTTKVGYPLGEAVALMDINPLMALLLKPFSPLLGEPFQYLGLEVALCAILQFFFALRLSRCVLGWKPLSMAMFSMFFLVSPPLTYRLVGHYSLSNHWVLLAALLVFYRAQEDTPNAVRRFVISSQVLAAVAIAINPYLAFQSMVTLTAAVVTLLWQHRVRWLSAGMLMSGLGFTSILVAYSIGFLMPGGKGFTSSGYRYYSMNLLAPFDPYWNVSIFYRALPHFTDGQYEGYNYLGAGVMLLVLLTLLLVVWRRDKLRSLDRRRVIPLFLCCAALILMACSTKVSIGSVMLLDLDPRERLTPYLAILRASGRLFWLPYYAILLAVLSVPLLYLRRPWANLVIALALCVQLADTAPLRKWVHTTVNQGYSEPLRSPVWTELGSVHKNLIVLPAWECDNKDTPGGVDGYRIFGFLAFRQRMSTNSYYAGRYNEVKLDFHCNRSIVALANEPLSPDSAYVVTPFLASVIASGPTGPGKCHDLDGYILCSAKSDSGLGPTLKTTAERVRDAIRDPGFEDEDLSTWPSFQNVKAVVTSGPAHSGAHSLAQSEGEGSVYQDITGLEPGRVYVVSSWVAGSPGATATAQIAFYSDSANLATFSSEVHVTPEWQLLTHAMAASASGSLRIHLFRKSGSGTIYWDDLSIYREN